MKAGENLNKNSYGEWPKKTMKTSHCFFSETKGFYNNSHIKTTEK